MPVLLALVVGLRSESIMIDVLHTIDLGITSHILGNVFFIFGVLRAAYGGGTYKERVDRLAEKMTAWYKRTKCSSRLQGHLTLDRIREGGGWPKLKGKTAALRHLSRFALEVVVTNHDGSDYDTRVQALVQLLVAFYDILESSSQFLSVKAKEQLPKIGQKLAELYGGLAQEAIASGQKLWKLSPKLHLAEHLLELQAVVLEIPGGIGVMPMRILWV